MVRAALLTSVACFAALPGTSVAQDNASHCHARNLMQISAKGRGQSQTSRLHEFAEVEDALQAADLRDAVPLEDLLWTSNINKDWSDCSGSDFYQKTGAIPNSELALKKGLVLKKGKCPKDTAAGTPGENSEPLFTKELSCHDTTGCHQWCSPVFQSDRDTKNWTRMDELCKSWDGHASTAKEDESCGKMSKIFSYIRTMVPHGKNRMYMKFAIPETTMCRHWCAPLWVTLYDTEDYGKAYRWCFGQKGDWGGCDVKESVMIEEFKEFTFKLHMFSVKHLYKPKEMKIELAVYNEFLSTQLLIQNITFFHKAKPAAAPGEDTSCGNEDECDEDMKCCPNTGASNGKCCPETSNCCEELCCPNYYICNPSLEGAARCSPPPEAPDAQMKNISLCQE